ncbi:translocator protein [Choiromyces venosus 120613-1]|uniref:Translocator protein n=1 Tax=Choiromyces venosus 120613-1 TaxID=1336337 RepID=A0A3N4J7Q7_9PEZI|nr:translocator protein [Choiromyces venosus 120613-1]
MTSIPHIPSITLPAFIFASPAASILLPITLGSAIGYSTQPKKTQKAYNSITQPPLHPPAWVFGPTWTLLYGTMGYAAHRATALGLSSPNARIRTLALTGATLYSTQLALNLAWMPIFFGARQPALALVDIVALMGNVGCLAYVWKQCDPLAAWLMVPYLGWLGFATYLNVGVGVLNGWNMSGAGGEVKLVKEEEEEEEEVKEE